MIVSTFYILPEVVYNFFTVDYKGIVQWSFYLYELDKW